MIRRRARPASGTAAAKIGALQTLGEAWRLLWEMDAYAKRRLVIALVMVGLAAVLNGLAPLALKGVVDGLDGAATGVSQWLFALVAIYALSLWLARVASELRAFAFGGAERRMYRSLSERLFSHVIRLPMRFHFARQVGAVSEALTTGLQGFQQILQYLAYTILPVVLELATVVVVLLHLHQPVFMGLFLVALGCYAAVFGWGIARITGPARAAAAAQVDARGLMVDYVSNVELLKYFGAEQAAQQQFDAALAEGENHLDTYNTRRLGNGVLVATIFGGFVGVTVAYAAWLVQLGAMTLGEFVLVCTYILQLVRPVEMLGVALQQLARGLVFVERMLELRREVPEAHEAGVPLSPDGCGELEFDRVSLRYGTDRRVLADVSFRVPAGQTLGIVGASGAGKSTLLRLAVRLIEPDSGRILLDGQRISELALPTLRAAIAVVPQETVLLNDTVANNIRLGHPDCTQTDIERAARMAQLHDFIMRQPDGYDTRVGERGIRLSGGERQRVSIARAVLRQPRIFWFDEATSSLDTVTERQIVQNLREIAQLCTTVVVAHRLSSVEHADEIVVLHRGRIAERGTHAELLASDGIYAGLWSAQQGGTGIPASGDLAHPA